MWDGIYGEVRGVGFLWSLYGWIDGVMFFKVGGKVLYWGCVGVERMLWIRDAVGDDAVVCFGCKIAPIL